MKVKRTGPTAVVRGLGLVVQGSVYDLPTVPAGSGWQVLDARERVTEPAPARDYSALTVRELREVLTERDISVPAGSVKADLISLLEGGEEQ